MCHIHEGSWAVPSKAFWNISNMMAAFNMEHNLISINFFHVTIMNLRSLNTNAKSVKLWAPLSWRKHVQTSLEMYAWHSDMDP
jgi:hypothetical protein